MEIFVVVLMSAAVAAIVLAATRFRRRKPVAQVDRPEPYPDPFQDLKP
jgi:hypothetical protein